MADEQPRKLYGAAAVAAGAGQRFNLTTEKVAQQWNFIVEKGAGRDQWVLDNVMELIKEADMPEVTCIQAEVGSGMFSEKRNFLVVRHNKLRDYRLYINARNFGINLDVSWYLTIEPRFLKRTMSKYSSGNPHALSQNIDVFSHQDLGAYVTVVEHVVKRVLDMLLEELKQDPSGLHNAQSKGFLNVW